jgi:prolyl oligopeptidase
MRVLLATLISILLAGCSRDTPEANMQEINYPETAAVDHVDTYHGVEVADPYRWLEDDVRESSAVENWVSAQNDVTFAYLATSPERELIRKRMTELWDYERFGLPRKEGGRYFYSYNDGLQNQNVVYTQAGLDAEAEILVDPNTWSEDGTIALADYYPSPDGRHVAYLVQDGGSDWREAKILDIATGRELDDHLQWLKFTDLSWAKDGSGFFYSRYPATAAEDKYQSLNKNMTVYFHVLGTPQDEDRVVYARPDQPEWGPGAEVTEDGEHLVITIAHGTDDRYQIVHQDLTDADAEAVMIIEGFDYDYSLIGNIGSELFFRTNNGAPRNRLIVIDVKNPQPENWREIIGEAEDVLDDVSLVGGRIVAEYMQDAWSVVKIFDIEGNQVGNVDLPGIGTASGFAGKYEDVETFFSYESFNSPGTISRLNVVTGEVEVFRKPWRASAV